MVVREPSLKDNISKYLLDRISAAGNVHVRTNSAVTGLEGDQVLEAIFLTDLLSGRRERFGTRWLFVCIGGDPRTSWAEEVDRSR
jgi:thioredoxin reductase (NADPH)